MHLVHESFLVFIQTYIIIRFIPYLYETVRKHAKIIKNKTRKDELKYIYIHGREDPNQVTINDH